MAEDMEQQVDAIFPPKAKVYCGNCFWYVPSRATPYGSTPPRCRHPHAQYEEETSEGIAIVRIPPERRNSQHDCHDWRHKTFYSDVGHHAFKRMMVLLALFFVLAWCWRMLTP